MDEEGITKACGFPLLPLKSHIKGPAPVSEQGIISMDIVLVIHYEAGSFRIVALLCFSV